jgi:tetratricopeptide (TPR) repeat protein
MAATAGSVMDGRGFKTGATVAVALAALLACAVVGHRAVAYQRAVRGAALFADGDPLTAYPYLLDAARAGLLARHNAGPLRDLGELATWVIDDARFQKYHPELGPPAAARLAFTAHAAGLIRRPASSYTMAGLADLVRRVSQIGGAPGREGEPIPLSWVRPLSDGTKPTPEDRLVEAAYRRAIEMEPSNYFWFAYLADFFQERGRRAEALPLYQKAIELMPDLGWHYYLGSGGRLPDDMFQAVRSGLEAALAGDPAFPPEKIEASLGSVHERQGDHETALLHYRRAIERAPDPSRYLFMAASTMSSLGRRDEALAYYRRALEAGGLNRRQEVAALTVTGRILLLEGQAREAAEALARARALDPGSYNARLDLGRAWEALGELDKAEAEYIQAMGLDPTATRAYELLIGLYRSRHDVARAIPLARRLVEMYPDDPRARQQLDMLYREMVPPAPGGPS